MCDLWLCIGGAEINSNSGTEMRKEEQIGIT
jgi:hypothetical protein